MSKTVKDLTKNQTDELIRDFKGINNLLLTDEVAKVAPSFKPVLLNDGRIILIHKYMDGGVLYANRESLYRVLEIAVNLTDEELESEVYPFDEKDFINMSQVKKKAAVFFNIPEQKLNWTIGSLEIIDRKVRLFAKERNVSGAIFNNMYHDLSLYAAEVLRKTVKGEWHLEKHPKYLKLYVPKIKKIKNHILEEHSIMPRIYSELKENAENCSVKSIIESEFF